MSDQMTRRSRWRRGLVAAAAACAMVMPAVAGPAGAAGEGTSELVERAPVARTTDAAMAIERPSFTNVPCLSVTDSIVRLYSAYFLRAPDEGGFEFWRDGLETGAWSLPAMSAFFSQSPEFEQRYGALTDAQFIDLIYQNIFGRQADAGGRDFWLGRMANEGLDRGTVMLNFSESPEYIEQTGTVLSPAGYFNWYPAGTRFTCGFGSMEHQIASFPTWMDVHVFNFLEDPIVIRYEVLQSGTWTLVQESTLRSAGTLSAFGWALSTGSINRIRLTSDSTFSWTVAESPTVTPEVRAGW